MIKKIILFSFVIVFLNNCGYTPIYSKKNLNFEIETLTTTGEAKVNKILFTSSPTVFGDADKPLTEDLPMKPESLYGASKLASEAYIRAFSSLYGLQSWILRLSQPLASACCTAGYSTSSRLVAAPRSAGSAGTFSSTCCTCCSKALRPGA